MMKYTDEQKAKALETAKEIGVKKTQEQLGISVQTLYKWRNEASASAGEPKVRKARTGKAIPKEAKALLKENDGREAAIKRLEAENAKLREQNDKLKKALAAVLE